MFSVLTQINDACFPRLDLLLLSLGNYSIYEICQFFNRNVKFSVSQCDLGNLSLPVSFQQALEVFDPSRCVRPTKNGRETTLFLSIITSRLPQIVTSSINLSRPCHSLGGLNRGKRGKITFKLFSWIVNITLRLIALCWVLAFICVVWLYLVSLEHQLLDVFCCQRRHIDLLVIRVCTELTYLRILLLFLLTGTWFSKLSVGNRQEIIYRVVILVIPCITRRCLVVVGRTEITELVLCTVSAIMQSQIDAVLSLTQRRINFTVFSAR